MRLAEPSQVDSCESLEGQSENLFVGTALRAVSEPKPNLIQRPRREGTVLPQCLSLTTKPRDMLNAKDCKWKVINLRCLTSYTHTVTATDLSYKENLLLSHLSACCRALRDRLVPNCTGRLRV